MPLISACWMHAGKQPAKRIGATASRIVCRACKDNDLFALNLEFTLVRPELTGSHYDTMYARPVEFIGGKLVSRSQD